MGAFRRGVDFYRSRLKKIDESEVEGLERYFDVLLCSLNTLSILYWLLMIRFKDLRQEQKLTRLYVEVYVLAKIAVLFGLLQFPGTISCLLAMYLLADLYVALLLVVFVAKHVPGSFPLISGSRPSLERLLILLMGNVAEVTLAFALFYRMTLAEDPGPWRAIAYSIQVLGTVGTPPDRTGSVLFVVSWQIVLDFVLLAIFLARLIGETGLFGSKPE